MVILSDSKSVISALNRIDTTSKALKEAKDALNALADEHGLTIEVRWIKAHNGIIGNEIADRAAKTGANLLVRQEVGLSKAATKDRVTTHLYRMWNEKWKNQESCRQTRMFIPEIDRGKSKKIMSLKKTDLGILVRHVTGHAHLARHNIIAQTALASDNSQSHYSDNDASVIENADNILDTVDISKDKHNAICRLCHLRGMEETPLHLVLKCPATWKERAELFGKYEVNEVDLPTWEPDKLIEFFTHYNLEQED